MEWLPPGSLSAWGPSLETTHCAVGKLGPNGEAAGSVLAHTAQASAGSRHPPWGMCVSWSSDGPGAGLPVAPPGAERREELPAKFCPIYRYFQPLYQDH